MLDFLKSFGPWLLPDMFAGWHDCGCEFKVEFDRSWRRYEVIVVRDSLDYRFFLKDFGPDLLVLPEMVDSWTRSMALGSRASVTPHDPAIGKMVQMVRAHHNTRYKCTPLGLSYLWHGEPILGDILSRWLRIDGPGSADGVGARIAEYFSLVNPIVMAIDLSLDVDDGP